MGDPVPVLLDLLGAHDQLRIDLVAEQVKHVFDFPPFDGLPESGCEVGRVARRCATGNPNRRVLQVLDDPALEGSKQGEDGQVRSLAGSSLERRLGFFRGRSDELCAAEQRICCSLTVRPATLKQSLATIKAS